MELQFRGEVVFWRGPAPWYFVVVPEEPSAALEAASPSISYGWGCIAVTARIGATTCTTALFPKDGRYLVPVKAAVRRAEGLDVDDVVDVELRVTPPRAPAGAGRRS